MNQLSLKILGEIVPEKTLQALYNEWNPIITVDRTIRPSYPDLVREVKYPELELAGPAKFDVRKIKTFLHYKQMDCSATGNKIHEELLAKKLLEDCLGLADLWAIRARGIGFFQKYFAGKAIFGWKSVVMGCDGGFYVPYLCDEGDEVKLRWRWLCDNFYFNNHALYFAS